MSSVKDTAAEIVALVNSSPRTPWPEEIEAIIVRMTSPAPAEAPSALAVEARTLMAEMAAGPAVKRQDPIIARLGEIGEEVWRSPARSFDDLRLFAELARFFNNSWTPFEPSEHHDCWDHKSLRMLAKAVLAFTSSAAAAPSGRPTALAGWADTVARFLDETASNKEEAYDQAEKPLEAAMLAIWAKPVRSWDDLVTRAAIAVHWNSPCRNDEPPYPDWVWAGEDEVGERFGYDEIALAHVVRGILDLAGLTFNPNGRLLSGPTRGDAHHG